MNTNEETVLNQNENQNEQTVVTENNAAQQADAATVVSASKGYSWAIVTLSGISGVLLGSASTLLAHDKIEAMVASDEEESQEETETVAEETTATNVETETMTIEVHHDSVNMASSVNDNMSFSEAFAAARHEVGAGGAFVWHGGVYGTYYASEWNQMSAEEQHAFTADAMSTPHHTDYTTQNPTSYDTASSDTETNTLNTVAEDGNSNPTDDDLAVNVVDNDDDLEIEVLGVEENVTLSDGSVANIGFATVEGHAAMFIDDDNDHVFDSVVIDANDNGTLDDQDVAGEVNPDLGLTVESFNEELNAQMQDPAVAIYAQMPDYTNDANITDLA